jgi:hypothetical protein
MAHLSKIPLNDDKSHDFMKRCGFTNIDSLSYESTWSNNSTPPFSIPTNEIVRNNAKLYTIIYQAGLKLGKHLGASEQKKKIEDNMNKFMTQILS